VNSFLGNGIGNDFYGKGVGEFVRVETAISVSEFGFVQTAIAPFGELGVMRVEPARPLCREISDFCR